MTFCWVIGVEGAGHHMLRAVLQIFLERGEVVDKGDHYPLFLRLWDERDSSLPFAAVRSTFREILPDYLRTGKRHVFEDTSFPFGSVEPPYRDYDMGGCGRGKMRRPNVRRTLSALAGICVPRILVLYRNPVLTVNSVLRRGFSNDVANECELVSSMHQYIAAELFRLPAAWFRTLDTSAFLADPERYLGALSQWWNLPLEILRAGLKHLKQAATLADVPGPRRKVLETFFSPNIVSQWMPAYLLKPLQSA